MKRCPECRRDYYDDTLSFCLEDGAALVSGVPDEAPTAILHDTESHSEAKRRAEAETTNDTIILPGDVRQPVRESYLIIGVAGFFLISALIIGVGGYFYYEQASVRQIESIAVMPFANKTGNSELDYLSEGMTDSVIGILSQVPGLRVKARSSVFRYAGRDVDVKTLGRELGVQTVLNGRLVQRGDGFSIGVELTDTTGEDVIWAGQYDRTLSELGSPQNEIARVVADKLQKKLSGTDRQRLDRRPTENTEAYRQYLLGRYEWNKRRKESLLRAVEHFKKAIEIDPGFALAYAGLADCYIVFATYEVAEPVESYALARSAVQKALELDDTHGEAYATLASINDDYDWNFPAAERNYLRAIELNPNYAVAHQWYSEHLRMVGRFEEAIEHSNRAIDLDPVSLAANLGLGEAFYLAGRCEDAIKQFHRTIELDPGFATAYIDLARCYDVAGNYEQAIAEGRKAVETSGGSNSSLANLAFSLAKAGAKAEAEKIIEELEERGKSQFIDGAAIARIHYALGDLDGTFASLEKALKQRSPGVRYVKVDPRYGADFRSDPRYLELIRKVGLP